MLDTRAIYSRNSFNTYNHMSWVWGVFIYTFIYTHIYIYMDTKKPIIINSTYGMSTKKELRPEKAETDRDFLRILKTGNEQTCSRPQEGSAI